MSCAHNSAERKCCIIPFLISCTAQGPLPRGRHSSNTSLKQNRVFQIPAPSQGKPTEGDSFGVDVEVFGEGVLLSHTTLQHCLSGFHCNLLSLTVCNSRMIRCLQRHSILDLPPALLHLLLSAVAPLPHLHITKRILSRT